MNQIPIEAFGIKVNPPTPAEFTLTDEEIRIFEKKRGILGFLDAEYSSVRHKKEQYQRYIEKQQAYSLNCFMAREEYWLSLTPEKFEWHVGKVFQALGFQVHLTGRTGDKGIDFQAWRKEKYCVGQCKAFNKRVGPAAVRDFYGTITSERAFKGYLCSLRGFTDEARMWAML